MIERRVVRIYEVAPFAVLRDDIRLTDGSWHPLGYRATGPESDAAAVPWCKRFPASPRGRLDAINLVSDQSRSHKLLRS